MARRSRLDEAVPELPCELWIHIGHFLEIEDIARLCSVSKQLAKLQALILEQACYRRWPELIDVAQELRPKAWRHRWRQLAAHETELKQCPKPTDPASTKQPVVCSRHRAILVEWLIEVRKVVAGLLPKPRVGVR
jgi:hypothetical protein